MYKEKYGMEEIKKLLGGYNCGGCGYEDCEHCALAIKSKEAPEDICPVMDEENVEKIKAILEKIYKK